MQPNQIATVETQPAGQLQRAFGAFSPAVLVEQVQLIQQAMRDVMREGEHFGVIPGTERKDKDGNDVSKRTLFKAGAEKLGFLFRLAPKFRVKITGLGNGHRDFSVTCRLYSIHTGAFVGEGVGSCSTMESKYRWRKGGATCPECGKDLRLSKEKPEWYCWAKQGGCGKTYPKDSVQAQGRTENSDIADCYNTCRKMAKKRAHVDAMLTATAASDIFTQDLEDLGDEPGAAPAPAQPTAPRRAAPAQKAAPPEPSEAVGRVHDKVCALHQARGLSGIYALALAGAGFSVPDDWQEPMSAEEAQGALGGWPAANLARVERWLDEQLRPRQQPQTQATPTPQEQAPAPVAPTPAPPPHVADEAEARQLVPLIDRALRAANPPRTWKQGLAHVGARLPSDWREPETAQAALVTLLPLLGGDALTVHQLKRLAKELAPKHGAAPQKQPA